MGRSVISLRGPAAGRFQAAPVAARRPDRQPGGRLGAAALDGARSGAGDGHGDRDGVKRPRFVQDDASYYLMVGFYTALKEPSVSKAEALRRAQLKLITSRAYAHPYYWSPFLLISTWL